MEITYLVGNILDAQETIIVQGVNAQGVMGSDLAKSIRDRYPHVFDDYRRVYDTQGLALGDVIWSDCDRYIIANAVTQEFYGRDPVRYCSYDAIAIALERIDAMALSCGVDAVALPLIGAGLARGDWKIISAIIKAQSRHFKPMVYLRNGKIP